LLEVPERDRSHAENGDANADEDVFAALLGRLTLDIQKDVLEGVVLTNEMDQQFERCSREEPCHRTLIASVCSTSVYDASSETFQPAQDRMWERASQNRTLADRDLRLVAAHKSAWKTNCRTLIGTNKKRRR
jgi:hypothetical protein